MRSGKLVVLLVLVLTPPLMEVASAQAAVNPENIFFDLIHKILYSPLDCAKALPQYVHLLIDTARGGKLAPSKLVCLALKTVPPSCLDALYVDFFVQPFFVAIFFAACGLPLPPSPTPPERDPENGD